MTNYGLDVPEHCKYQLTNK